MVKVVCLVLPVGSLALFHVQFKGDDDQEAPDTKVYLKEGCATPLC
jgi:hypothetical protein